MKNNSEIRQLSERLAGTIEIDFIRSFARDPALTPEDYAGGLDGSPEHRDLIALALRTRCALVLRGRVPAPAGILRVRLPVGQRLAQAA